MIQKPIDALWRSMRDALAYVLLESWRSWHKHVLVLMWATVGIVVVMGLIW